MKAAAKPPLEGSVTNDGLLVARLDGPTLADSDRIFEAEFKRR